MTASDARYSHDIAMHVRRQSYRRLHLLVKCLTEELEYRGTTARLEARALQLALLVEAQDEHRAIYSEDCRPAE